MALHNKELLPKSEKFAKVSSKCCQTFKKIAKNFKILCEIEELLPTTKGFFFGNTEYDNYYVSDIKSTIEGLEQILSEDVSHGEFYYQSSW